MPPKPFHSVKPYAWASLRWTDTICRMKPESEAAMDMIPYVLWHATGMFGLNTSATTRAGGNMQKMLEDNEIDIGTSTHKTPDWEKKFDFSRPIGSNECMITVRNDNTSFVVQDYTTYNMHNFLSASK